MRYLLIAAVLVSAAAAAAVGGYAIGRMALRRGWNARQTIRICLPAGWISAALAALAVDWAAASTHFPALIGFGFGAMWLGWFVCGRVAGFPFDRASWDKPEGLGLSDRPDTPRR